MAENVAKLEPGPASYAYLDCLGFSKFQDLFRKLTLLASVAGIFVQSIDEETKARCWFGLYQINESLIEFSKFLGRRMLVKKRILLPWDW